MAKFSESLTALLKAMGVTLTPEQTAELAEADVDVPEKAQAHVDAILNKHLSEYEKKARAATFDATDKALATLKDKLSGLVDEAEFDAILKEKGIETKLSKLGTKLAEAKTKLAAAGTSADVKKFEEEIRKLNADIKTATDSAEERVKKAVEEERQKLGGQLLEKELVNRFATRADVSEDAKKNRRFSLLLKSDFEDLLLKKGVKVDPFTQKVVKADDGQPLFVKNVEVTFDNLLDEIAAMDDYKKQSDGNPGSGTVDVPTSDKNKGDDSKFSPILNR